MCPEPVEGHRLLRFDKLSAHTANLSPSPAGIYVYVGSLWSALVATYADRQKTT